LDIWPNNAFIFIAFGRGLKKSAGGEAIGCIDIDLVMSSHKNIAPA
jgi:hypothetical protein